MRNGRAVANQFSSSVQRISLPKVILFLLLASYLLIAPVSVSSIASSSGYLAWLKWGRVGILLACGSLAIGWFRLPATNRAGFWLVAFSLIYWLAATWSNSPVWGLAYKGLFFSSVIAGGCIASAITRPIDLSTFCRSMTFAGLVGLVAAAVVLSAGNASMPIFVHGRLSIAGINANMVAQVASVLCVMTFFHWTIELDRVWKLLACIGFGLLLITIVLTGSRGAMIMCSIGVIVQLPLLTRRRRVQAIVCSLGAVVVIALGLSVIQGGDEQSDLMLSNIGGQGSFETRMWNDGLKDTRSRVWKNAFKRFLKSPVIGQGWLNNGSHWATVQSSYLQVLVEAGVLGGGIVLLFLWVIAVQICRAVKSAINARDGLSSMTYLCAALTIAILLHAVFESSAVVGSTPNSFLLGFCVFHLDHRLDSSNHPERNRKVRGRASSSRQRYLANEQRKIPSK